MTTVHENRVQDNDDICVQLRDGDIIIDKEAEQILDWAVLHKSSWAIPRGEPGEMKSFKHVDQPPILDRRLYIYRSDPRSPLWDQGFLEQVIVETIKASEQGEYMKFSLEGAWDKLRYWLCIAGFLAVVGMGWLLTNHNAEIIKEEMALKRSELALKSQPTGEGLPSTSEIEEIIEERESGK